MSRVIELSKAGHIEFPFVANPQYIALEICGGSRLFGSVGDWDIIGIAVPPAWMMFPEFGKSIPLFDREPTIFTHVQEHHIEYNGDSYDVVVYSLLKYFALLANGSPQIIESLFVPESSLLHKTELAYEFLDRRERVITTQIGYPFTSLAQKEYNRATEVFSEEYDPKHMANAYRFAYDLDQLIHHREIDFDGAKPMYQAIRNKEVEKDELVELIFTKFLGKENRECLSKMDDTPIRERLRPVLADIIGHRYGLQF